MRIIGAENRWGHDPRPVWLWIGGSIGGSGGEGKPDPWEYDVEIEGEWARAQVLRRLVPGMPWIFINGEPLDPDKVRREMGLSPDTLQAKIRDHGAVCYTHPRTGDIFEFEIRLENLEEAAAFVQANRDREKERRKEEAREAARQRMIAMQNDPEMMEKRREAIRYHWKNKFGVNGSNHLLAPLMKLAEEIKPTLTYHPRPPSSPGARHRRIYCDGVPVTPKRFTDRMGWTDPRVLGVLLRQGDFTLKTGEKVTQVDLTDEEMKKERGEAASRTMLGKMPYSLERPGPGYAPTKSWLYTLNGEVMSLRQAAKIIDMNHNRLCYLCRSWVVVMDGKKVTRIPPPAP